MFEKHIDIVVNMFIKHIFLSFVFQGKKLFLEIKILE